MNVLTATIVSVMVEERWEPAYAAPTPDAPMTDEIQSARLWRALTTPIPSTSIEADYASDIAQTQDARDDLAFVGGEVVPCNRVDGKGIMATVLDVLQNHFAGLVPVYAGVGTCMEPATVAFVHDSSIVNDLSGLQVVNFAGQSSVFRPSLTGEQRYVRVARLQARQSLRRIINIIVNLRSEFFRGAKGRARAVELVEFVDQKSSYAQMLTHPSRVINKRGMSTS